MEWLCDADDDGGGGRITPRNKKRGHVIALYT